MKEKYWKKKNILINLWFYALFDNMYFLYSYSMYFFRVDIYENQYDNWHLIITSKKIVG